MSGTGIWNSNRVRRRQAPENTGVRTVHARWSMRLFDRTIEIDVHQVTEDTMPWRGMERLGGCQGCERPLLVYVDQLRGTDLRNRDHSAEGGGSLVLRAVNLCPVFVDCSAWS